MDEAIRIEKMTADDIPAVYALNLEAFEEDPWPLQWFYEAFEEPPGHYFLVYNKNDLVGYCGIYHITSISPNYCKIATLAVAPAHRRKGIGRLLVQKMLDCAKDLGLDRTKLEVDTKNSAIKLYQEFGFKIEELKEKYFEKSGNDGYIMWRYD